MPDTSANPFSLAGRVALVTGSSTGLGKVMAIVKPKLAGRADMGAVSALIKKALAPA